MVPRKLLYLLSFLGLAATAALAVDRVGEPSLAPLLGMAVIAGTVAGGLGLVHRRAWPLGLVLIPLGAFLLLRAQLAPPPTAHGLWQQLSFLREQLGAAGQSYVTQRLPFDYTVAPELRLLLSFLVYLATALSAFAALSLRRALPAVVGLLVLLGFGLTVDGADKVVLLTLAFLLLSGCLLMLSRSLVRERWKPADSLAGVATTVIASLLGLSLLGATSAAASQPWQDWRTWGGPVITHQSTTLGLDSLGDYPRLLDPAHNSQVMKVNSPVASYWRANALDSFTGTNWFGDDSLAEEGALTPRADAGVYRYEIPGSAPELPGKLVTEGFEISSLYTDYFFAGGAPRTLVLGKPVSVQVNSAGGLRTPAEFIGPKIDYEVTAVVSQLKPADLVGRGREYPSRVYPDTEMPFPTPANLGPGTTETQWRQAMSGIPAKDDWLGLFRLNRTIVGQATDPYDVALRIEEYLRLNYIYSLNPPATADESPYAAFLFTTRTGFCQHFAGAMAALLRFNGIPARVALGFATGRKAKDDTFIVSRTDAHAWVEVFFPQVGWVPFDPTPGRSLPGQGTSSTNAGFVSPFTADGAAVGGLPRSTDNADAPIRGRFPGGGGRVELSASNTSVARSALPWVIALAVVLLGWPLARVLLRRRAARRGGPDRRLRASLALMFAELRDYGVRVPRSQTLEETSRFLKERVGLDATGVVDRVQAVLFGGRRASGQDLADVAQLRRELRGRLRKRSGWRRGLLALYGLPGVAAERG